MNEISRDELALYDRQIRLWGIEAQKRLQEGYVLVIAAKMDNLVQEICKNLALCGISKLSLKLITTESSENIIYSSFESELKEIHPRLLFECSLTDAGTLNFQDFNFIVACGQPDKINFTEINLSSRKLGKNISLCFLYENKVFMWNDFYDFSLNSPNGSKTLTFPSFVDVLESNGHYPKSDALLDSFYEAINGQKESSSELEKATEVAGSAILGALVSQEVIKSFSRKDNPINNLFILDLQNLKNSIIRVGIIS